MFSLPAGQAHAPQAGFYLGAQHGGGEGLCDIVVGADAQRQDFVVVRLPAAEHKDGQQNSLIPEGPNDLEPVHAVHDNVQNHQIKGLFLGHAQGIRTVGSLKGGEALAGQNPGNCPAHKLFIVYNQYFCCLQCGRLRPEICFAVPLRWKGVRSHMLEVL